MSLSKSGNITGEEEAAITALANCQLPIATALLRPRRIVPGSRRRRARLRIRGSPRIRAMRHRTLRRRTYRSRMRRIRPRSHRALRIQQVIVARPQPQADQRARIRHRLRLPAMIRLILPHSVFAVLVPASRRVGAQIMLANQSLLYSLRPLGIDLLLPARRLLLPAFARARARTGRLRAPAVRTGRLGCGTTLRRSASCGATRRMSFTGTRWI